MAKKLTLPGGAKRYTNAVSGVPEQYAIGRKGTELGRNATITEAMFQKELKRMAEQKEKLRKEKEAKAKE